MKSGKLKTKVVVTVAAAAVMFMGTALVSNTDAHANSRAKKAIKKMVDNAMENYDLMEFEDAKKLLSKAIVHAKKKRVSKAKWMAWVHVRLGIVYFAGLKDKESAKLEFINAVEIDKNVQIPAEYKTGAMVAILKSAKKEFGGKSSTGNTGTSGGGGSNEPSVDCGALTSMAHTIVDETPGGKSKGLMAHVSGKLRASKVVLHYRPKGDANFTQVKMSKSGECGFKGTIPGKVLKGDFLHYYIAAYNKKGKQIARKGSSGSPNVIEITAAVGGSGGGSGGGIDTENPLAKGGGSGGGSKSGGSVKKSLTGKSKSSLFISVAVGTGAGFVTGNTEQEQNEVGCCVAPALLHLFPEIGYFMSPTTSISLAFRLGFTIGANIQGHSTGAPAALLRFRKALSEDGNGLQLNAAIGGGIIRHTVKLKNAADPAMDTDTTATGPLFIGGGAAYTKPLSGSLKFVFEANAIAGVPVVEEFGGVTANFALHLDVNIGFMFGF